MEQQEFTKRKFDLETEQGTIIRGIIYTERPSFNYTETLKSKNKVEEIKKLKKLKEEICKDFRLNKQDISIDKEKYRLCTSRRIVVKYQNNIKLKKLIPAIIEFDPKNKELDIEVEFL